MKERVLLMKLQGSYVNLTMKLQESYVVFSYKSMSGVKNTKVGIVKKHNKIPDPENCSDIRAVTFDRICLSRIQI